MINPDACPFIAYEESRPIGFALVTKGSHLGSDSEVWDMHEFFILRPYRSSGLGFWLAREMYSKFPGKWEIRIGVKNKGAPTFW